ncbi:MAG: GNAT family N-acetyltransferase [Nitrosopumilus sp.]|nr:GNAT family N-acetyltransferase [Nitrosopumilus sp.]
MKWSLLPVNEYNKYREQWDALNASNSNSLLLDSDFVIPLIDNFSSGKEILAIARKNDLVVAMFILIKKHTGVWESFQPSQAPVSMSVYNPELLDETLQSLCKTLKGITLMLGITQLDPDMYSRPAPSKRLTTMDYIQTSRISVSGSFEEYWKKRGKNLRQNMNKQRNRLNKNGIKTKLELITDPDRMADAIIDYGNLESSGWKLDLGTAVNIENQQGIFYRQIMERFARKGQATVYKYWYGNDNAAMDICIHNAETIIILKTTYNEEFKSSSPAMLMRQESFEAIFENKTYQKIEFYGKVMEWHKRWTDEIRTMYHLNFYCSPLASFLYKLLRKS